MKEINIYQFLDYKEYVRKSIQALPSGGRGQYRRMADYLKMSTVMISQIFKGERHINLEQGFQLGHFLELPKDEREYLFEMIHYARAGSHALSEFHLEKLKNLQKESKKLSALVKAEKTLDENTKARFYANWIYSGVRLYSSLGEGQTLSAFEKRFNLTKEKAAEIIDFLLENGLCERKGNKIRMGPQKLHLEGDSPYVRARQIDWRLKSFQNMQDKQEGEMFFTAPLSCSFEAEEEINKILQSAIKEISNTVVKQKAETLRCLNIDYFKF